MQAAHTMQAHLDAGAMVVPCPLVNIRTVPAQWDEPVNDLIAEAQVHNVELVTPLIGQSWICLNRSRPPVAG